jgi:shikimate kinase
MKPHVIVIAGVAGCGKATVGEMLASRLGWDFADADDYHPEEHKAMTSDGTDRRKPAVSLFPHHLRQPPR